MEAGQMREMRFAKSGMGEISQGIDSTLIFRTTESLPGTAKSKASCSEASTTVTSSHRFLEVTWPIDWG